MFITQENNKVIVDINKISEYEEKGLLKINTYSYNKKLNDFYNDPNGIYAVINYTPTVQFNKLWDEVTLTCRGLVVNLETKEIISRPFLKFFNYFESEVKLDLNSPAVVSKKYDGSMVAISKWNDIIFISSRSTLKNYVTDLVRKILKDKAITLEEGTTHLFELISPEDLHIEKYNFEDIVYLGSVINSNGEEDFFREIWPRRAEKILVTNLKKFLNKIETTEFKGSIEEGYVVEQFTDKKVKAKIKYKQYLELHRVMNNLSTKRLFKLLEEKELDFILKEDFEKLFLQELLEKIPDYPDEFFNYLKDIIYRATLEFKVLYYKHLSIYKDLDKKFCSNWLEMVKELKTLKDVNFSLVIAIHNNSEKVVKLILKIVYDRNFKEQT